MPKKHRMRVQKAAAASAAVNTSAAESTKEPQTDAVIPFVRISNQHIRFTQKRDSKALYGFSSLSVLGLYAMLSALLSNPAFETASGGMQRLLSAHCKNGAFSLTGALRSLRADGYLCRTRIATAQNRFSDYYDLSETKGRPQTSGMSPIGVRNLTTQQASAYLASRVPFSPPTEDFTMVSMPMLLDARLSLAAKGLYAVIARYLRLASHNADIVLSKHFLSSVLPIGENAFDRLFGELRKTGYLSLTRARDPLTGKGFYRYALHPNPQTVPAVTKTDARSTHSAQPDVDTIAPTVHSTDEVRARMEYDCLKAEYPRDRLDCILSILSSFSGGKVPPHLPPGIDGSPAEIAARFAALDSEDVRYVLDTYAAVSRDSHIRNVRAYLTTCLFHAKENLRLALDRLTMQTPGLV